MKTANEKRREALMFILAERECPNCQKFFQPTNMRHTFCSKKCGGEYAWKLSGETPLQRSDKFKHLRLSSGRYQCPHCNRTFTISGLHPHIWRVHTKEGREFGPMLSHTSWCKGLTKETDERVNARGEKIRESIKIHGHSWLGRHHEQTSKKKISKKRKDWFRNGGTNPNAGHSKKYEYKSPIAGKVSLDGTWELRVAIFFDGSELTWRRNKKGFKYIHPKTKEESTYIPDFFVYDWNTYIEVKGYISEVDRAKWKQFSEPLEVWDENILKRNGIL